MDIVNAAQVEIQPVDYRGWPVHALNRKVGVPACPLEINAFWQETGKVPYRRGVNEGAVGWPCSLAIAKPGFAVDTFRWCRYSVTYPDFANVDVTALAEPFLRTVDHINPFQAWRFRTLGNGIDAGPYGCVGYGFTYLDGGFGLDLASGSMPPQKVDGRWYWNSANIEIFHPTNFVVEVGYGNPVSTLSRQAAGYDWPAYPG